MTINPNTDGLMGGTGRIRLESGEIINIADLVKSGDGARVAVLLASGGRPADDPHTRIHQGVMYECGSIVAALANDAAFNVILTTPAADYPHAVMHPSLDGSLDVSIYEGAAFTGGTSLTINNLNRNSANTFSGSAVHTPTISDDGAQLMGCHVAGGTGPHAGGTGNGFDFEWMLKPSTNYLFRITNRSGQAQRGGICLYFYSAPLIGA